MRRSTGKVDHHLVPIAPTPSFGRVVAYEEGWKIAASGHDASDHHPLLTGLLTDGVPSEEQLVPKTAKTHEIFAPDDLIHRIDADGLQARGIETVRANASGTRTVPSKWRSSTEVFTIATTSWC
jgi:hypothetical protein